MGTTAGPLRVTEYATELRRATIELGHGNEARLERLYIHQHGREEMRLSWWQNGRMMDRPLDLAEADMVRLFAEGRRQRVFSEEFATDLRTALLP